MEENLIQSILMVCQILNKHNVRYLIVGGIALAFHGYYRVSKMSNGLPADKYDFDFWYDPTYENYFNLLNALEELGINISEFKNEQTPNPKKSFFTHEFEEYKVDFLPEILGLERFGKSYLSKSTPVLRGVEIKILSKKDLIKSKETTLRKKDKEDLDELKKLFPDE
ncbi:MAG: hypothetical protein WC699_04795 [Bacteroidales bacterium]|jgi:hypothetical protein